MSEFIKKLNEKSAPNPEDNIFSDIWKEYERVVLQSLVTSFGLDFIVHDQTGGDVDTIHSVKETGTFKNQYYSQKYRERGDYNPIDYHKDTNYREIVSVARDHFNETGKLAEDAYVKGRMLYFSRAKGIGPVERANLDHVISAHEIHDDPIRILTDLDGISLANSPDNLKFTNERLNKQMGDKSIEEYITWCENNPEKVNWDGVPGAALPEEVKAQLRREDQQSRDLYNATISKAYYTSPMFYKDMALAAGQRGLEMGFRQVLGFIFMEVWFSCKLELSEVPAGSEVSTCFDAIVRGVEKGVINSQKKYKNIISQFEQGFVAGLMASITTTVCNVFFTTQKNTVRNIRFGYAAITQAGNVLLINPDGLLIGDQLKAASVILASGASVIVGACVGDALATSPIGAIPEVGNIVVTFISTLVSGLMSCTLLILLDRSNAMNLLVAKMNQLGSLERDLNKLSNEIEQYMAELQNLDIDEFSKDAKMFSQIAQAACTAGNEDSLNTLLSSIMMIAGINNPWDGEFDSFMSDRNASLVFK